jgi:hypothetical protein
MSQGRRDTGPAVLVLLRSREARRSRVLRVALPALSLIAAYVVATALLPPVARFRLARSHMAVPWALWAVTQPVPAMYSFEHRWFAVSEPLSGTNPVHRRWWINHHPTRLLFEPEARLHHDAATPCWRLRIESRYREQELRSHYRMCRHADAPGIWVEFIGS